METFIERVPEFVSNHPLIIGALLLTVALVAFTEYQRFTRVGRPLGPMQATRLQNDEDGIVIDVRPRKAFGEGHILGAQSIPQAEIAQAIHQVKKYAQRPVILYDDGGFDAERAAKTLQKNGFQRLYVIDGGLPAWRKAELPTRSGSGK